MMRIGLFLATNLAVLFIINLIITFLGLNQPGASWDAHAYYGGDLWYGGITHLAHVVKNNGETVVWSTGHRATT